MLVIVKDEKGFYMGGKHKQGAEIEVSEGVYNANKAVLEPKEKETKPVKEKTSGN